MTPTSAYYEFGDFVLDVGQQCLLRRDTGQTTLLTAKVLDTLVYFVEHAGETLDKDVLLRSIWPGAIVEENSLTQNVSTLRQLLGEARGENRYIATISRKGYRFVAKVTRRDAPVSSSTPTTTERGACLCAQTARPARRWRGRTDCRKRSDRPLLHVDRDSQARPRGGPDTGDSSLQAVVAGRAQ